MPESHYGHYDELVEAGRAYLEGRISIGLFEETVNRILSYVRDGEGQFKSIDFPPDLKAQLREDLVKAERGFSLLGEGIEKVRQFVDLRDREILWQGLCLVKLGCDLLNEVMTNQERRLKDIEGEPGFGQPA